MRIDARYGLETVPGKLQAAALNPKWQAALFGLVYITILGLLFNTVYKIEYSGTGLYFDYASKVLSGGLPYRDFAMEYPPFSLVFFILPRLLAADWQTYAIFYQVEVMIFVLAGLLAVYHIAHRLGKSPWQLLSAYTLGILAVGPITGQQYDIFPAVMTLLSIYFFISGRHKAAWALLTLGALTKIFPAAIAPVFLLYYIRERQYKNILTGIITSAAVSLAVLLPFLIADPAGLGSLYSYHGQRGIQIESTYSSLLLLGHQLGWLKVGTGFDFGSYNLVGPTADTLARISVLLLPLFLAAAYWFIYRRMKAALNPVDEIASCSLLVVALLIAASKVFSPQYLIWLCPLIPFSGGRLRYILWTVFIAAGILSYQIFPVHYLDLVELKPGATAALLTRNLLIIAMVPLVIVSLKRSEKADCDQRRNLNRRNAVMVS
ncbi:MAG: glycosyltransferase family 87 protein [Dehalococcoidales bacterium]|nr:glycosyltransferase family 87 protein [Dehalococcoidales bacterium]